MRILLLYQDQFFTLKNTSVCIMYSISSIRGIRKVFHLAKVSLTRILEFWPGKGKQTKYLQYKMFSVFLRKWKPK